MSNSMFYQHFMQDDVHTFITTSGVPATVRKLLGGDQDILTAPMKRNERQVDRYNRLLARCVQKYGDIEKITIDVIKSMPVMDRKHILLELVQFTYDFREEITLQYPYKDEFGVNQIYEFTETLPKGRFVFKSYANKAIRLSEFVFKFTYLWANKFKINFKLPTVAITDAHEIESDGNRYLTDMLSMYSPALVVVNPETGVEEYENIDFTKVPMTFLNDVLAHIKKIEGSIDSIVTFDNPMYDKRDENGNLLRNEDGVPHTPTIDMDIQSFPSFFFRTSTV